MRYDRMQFSAEEDAEIWKFAMEEHEGYGRRTMWKLFIQITGSHRNHSTVNGRFTRYLLPNLPKTKFHVETKLKLCQQYNIPINDEFLKTLTKHAVVQLDSGGVVTSWQLKPGCPKNKDMELSDEEFMEITSPIVPKWTFFTPEEDAEIWKFAVENYKTYTLGGKSFWKRLVQKLKSDRPLSSFCKRFLVHLAPNMHLHDFDIAVKLELYKKSRVAVNEDYLETLREHAELELDDAGCITGYKLKKDRAEKRKMSEESDENQKKARVDETEVDTDDHEEEEIDLFYDYYVPENDAQNQEIANAQLPEADLNDTDNQQSSDHSVVATEDGELDVTLNSNMVAPVGYFEDIEFNNEDNQFTVLDDAEEKNVEQDEFENVDHDNDYTSKNSEVPDNNQQKPPKTPEVETVPKSVPEDAQAQKMSSVAVNESDIFVLKHISTGNRQFVEIQLDDHDVELDNDNQNAVIFEGNQLPAHEEFVENDSDVIDISQSAHDIKPILIAGGGTQNGMTDKMMEVMKNMMDNNSKVLETLSEISKTMSSINDKITRSNTRRDSITNSKKKECLQNIKKILSTLNVPGMEEIEQRIDTMLQNLSDSDATPMIPVEVLKDVLETVLNLVDT